MWVGVRLCLHSGGLVAQLLIPSLALLQTAVHCCFCAEHAISQSINPPERLARYKPLECTEKKSNRRGHVVELNVSSLPNTRAR